MTATTGSDELAVVHREVIGAVDELSMRRLSGWARYADSDDPVRLDLHVNGELVGGFEANEFRSDLRGIRADGSFAFTIDLAGALDSSLNLSVADCVPQGAEVALLVAGGSTLQGGTARWDGLAAPDHTGMALPDGQPLALIKGMLRVPLSARSSKWREDLVAAAKAAIDAGADAGLRLALCYGSLLGAVRTGYMIAHDDDVDLVLLTRAENMLDAVREMKAAQKYFRNLGYEVVELSNGQFKLVTGGGDLELDIFLAWSERDHLALSFTVKQGPALQDVLPLSALAFEGVDLPVPRRPEMLLAAIYGEGWGTPNSRFRWDIERDVTEFFAPMHNYERGAHSDYWNSYYSDHSAPAYPSQFAAFALSRLSVDTLVVDLGCGSARDTEFFARYGYEVLGIDYSGPAVEANSSRATEENWNDRAHFSRFDMSDLADVRAALEQVERLRAGRPVLIYSRFFFHAIDEATEGGSLILIREALMRSLGEALIEFRTLEDAERPKAQPDHYRRYVDPDDLVRKASETYGLICDYRVEGIGFATFKREDARVARLGLRRGI